MTNTNLTYFDDATISKTRSSFKVYFEDTDSTVIVPFSEVQSICKKTADDEEMVATLLAYIELARKRAITQTIRIRKISEENRIKNSIELLIKYPVEQLIAVVQGLKWHQIKTIFESDNPIEEIEEFV